MNLLHHYDPDNPYPESDGLPMAENTEQYDWLVKIKENLEILFADRADVFIAGDLLWYPLPDRKLASPMAPDVMVVFGRPKGKRGSYRQWEEGNIAPQVVFEILSPSNSISEMKIKQSLYNQHGVQEYYVYDPETNRLEIWIRENKHLRKMAHIHGWTSPLLGIRFILDRSTLHIFYPSGQPFLSSIELNHRLETALREKAAEQREKETALAEIARLQALLAQKS
jgi:Uma2 family endonuclease